MIMSEYGLPASLEEFVTGNSDVEMRQNAEKLRNALPKPNMVNTGLGEVDFNHMPESMKNDII